MDKNMVHFYQSQHLEPHFQMIIMCTSFKKNYKWLLHTYQYVLKIRRGPKIQWGIKASLVEIRIPNKNLPTQT